MNPERKIQPFCPNEIAVLSKKLSQQGIHHVAFDLDDTLLNTRLVFIQAMNEALSILDYNNDPKLIAQFKEAISKLRSEFQVNPAVIHVPLVNCALSLGLDHDDPKIAKARDRINQIYDGRDQYPIFPRARETVTAFTEAGAVPVLVSHGADPYTDIKLRQANMAHLFAHRASLDPNVDKASQWREVFNKLRIDPKKVLVVGNNLKEDVFPALRLGSKVVWVNKRLQAISSAAIENNFATGLAVIEQIDQLIPVLIEKAPPQTR